MQSIAEALHHVRSLKENVSNFVVPGYRVEVQRVLGEVDRILSPHAPDVPAVLTQGDIAPVSDELTPAQQVLKNMAEAKPYEQLHEVKEEDLNDVRHAGSGIQD